MSCGHTQLLGLQLGQFDAKHFSLFDIIERLSEPIWQVDGFHNVRIHSQCIA